MKTLVQGVLRILLVLACTGVSHAARISEVSEDTFGTRAAQFLSLQDDAVKWAVVGSILLGGCCGLMGAFLVVRRYSLMGDSLSHAVLPGVALGFLWNMTKDPVAIFIGAVVVGLLGAIVVQVLRRTTRHKEDAALGFVLSSFFAVGVCMLTMIQNQPSGTQSGLDKFMFGQAASLGEADVWLLACITLLVLCMVGFGFKEYLVTSFDPGFARSVGLKVGAIDLSLMLLLAFAIVAALQAVGVVLVSAMLVIPAATAQLLTDRFRLMLVLSTGFGMLAAALGAFASYMGKNLPTGPFMVLAAALLFTLALFFGPRHGIVARWWSRLSQRARVRRENTLKAMYHLLEADDFTSEQVAVRELAERRRETLEDCHKALAELRRHHLVTVNADHSVALFTPEGWQRACEIVRNHRLWELYLTHSANYAPDHVHDDAEEIEHLLSEAAVMQLEKDLRYARVDPHGKLIPGIEDMRRGARRAPDTATAILPPRP